jgi:1-acyl-sn-glycerol-3-phosphate acyltransferase
MRRALASARSVFSLLLVLVWMLLGTVPLYPFVLPLAVLLRPWRRHITSVYMKVMCGGILKLFEVGGARFERRGAIPTAGPCVILMNHQSLLDIATTTLMGRPFVPAFVPRRRYANWLIPLIGASIWLLECPVVDPKRDARAAVEVMRRAALTQRHGILIFPEGHRTVDGQMRPFRTAGTLAVLAARRVPVYAVATDGFWFGRRLVDFALNVHRIHGETEIIGSFEPPSSEAEIPRFIEGVRHAIAERVEEMRRRRHAHA